MQNSGGKIKTIIGDNVLYLSARFYAIVLFTTYSSSPWNFQSDQSHDQRDPITFALERCSIPLATSRANLISWSGGKVSSSESDFPRAVRRKLRRSPRGRYSKATYNTSKDMKWDITKTNKQTNKNNTPLYTFYSGVPFRMQINKPEVYLNFLSVTENYCTPWKMSLSRYKHQLCRIWWRGKIAARSQLTLSRPEKTRERLLELAVSEIFSNPSGPVWTSFLSIWSTFFVMAASVALRERS